MGRGRPPNGNYCSVPQCGTYASSKLSLHKFPSDEKMCDKWSTAMRIGKEITKYMHVCGRHFIEEDYYPAGPWVKRRKLKKNAVPSLYAPVGKVVVKKKSWRDPSAKRTYRQQTETECMKIRNINISAADPLTIHKQDNREDLPKMTAFELAARAYAEQHASKNGPAHLEQWSNEDDLAFINVVLESTQMNSNLVHDASYG